MSEVAYRVLIEGRVTGVGFRYSTLSETGRYPGLKGYVRNAASRTVECVLQGPEGDVNAMVAWLHKGPPSARVTDVKFNSIPLAPDRQPFRIT